MSAAEAILQRLRSLGVTVATEGNSLRMEPGSRVPSDLVAELRRHKPELLLYLWEHPEPPPGKYQFAYPGEGMPSDAEVAEVERRLHEQGCILLWCTELEDYVAFYRSEEDRRKVPPGFVLYSEDELLHLFGDPSDGPSLNQLRLIHQAKKYGGRIID